MDEEDNSNKNSNKVPKEGRTVRFVDKFDTEEESEEHYSAEQMEEDEDSSEDLVTSHPETIIAVPCEPRGNKFKMIRGSCDICATDSLIAEELLQGDLKDYVNKGLVNEDNTRSWDTGNGVFKSPGAFNIRKVHLPAFTKNRKLLVKFHVMPKRAKGEHSHKIILGMKELRRLKFIVDLYDNVMKWDGITIPMVPRGCWSQNNIDTFWRSENSDEVDVETDIPIFEHNGTALETNKYGPADID